MAVLNETQRQAVRDFFLRLVDPVWVEVIVTKAEIRATIDGIDDYFETNASAINLAIPVGPRGKLTTAQKALFVAYVALKRATG